MRPKTRRPAADIPTAPTADIAFLLVIYFMLTLALTATQGLDFALPPEAPEEVAREHAVLLQVMPAGALRLDGEVSDLRRLLMELQPKLRQNPQKPVLVHGDPGARYGEVVAVLDELRQAEDRGFEEAVRIVLPTEREWSRW